MSGSNQGSDHETEQPALLDALAPAPAPRLPAGATERLPVASVLVDTPIPHLDRPFDYAVPIDLDDKVVPGGRVKVRFSGRELAGYVVERRETPQTGSRLSLIASVVSALPVVSPEIFQLCRRVADRGAGVASDVLRAAVPPRAARVEAEFTDALSPDPGSYAPLTGRALPDPEASASAEAPASAETQDAAPGRARRPSRRAELALTSFGPDGWPQQVVRAVEMCRKSGRDAVIVLPDQRDLDRAVDALSVAFGAEELAPLGASMGPTPRYRSFLNLRFGRRHIAVGTRSAVFAPVQDLGLLLVLDDADPAHAEPRAPYHHVRDVALLRAAASDADLVFLSTSRSLEVQRLVERAWLEEAAPGREERRASSPLMISANDSFSREREGGRGPSRLPGVAYRTARAQLSHGPVLVQVARSGFVPALICQRCGTRQQCPHCHGPLSAPAHHSQSRTLRCRWCGLHHRRHRCAECGATEFRAGSRGADRTAQELGRAFPGINVISSTADHPVSEVGPDPALVVSTPGMEPVAEDGYTAALLLDGNAQLSREGLDVPRGVLMRWFRVASLVRAHSADPERSGTVVVSADAEDLTAALVRWDPVGYARRELYERLDLGLPPATRMLSVTGGSAAVDDFIGRVSLPESVHWIGPAPVDEEQNRYLLFFGYAQAEQIVSEVRRVRSTPRSTSTRSRAAPPADGSSHVRVVVDDIEALQV